MSIVQYLSENASVFCLYLLAAIFALFAIYIILCWANVAAKHRNAATLKELLETAGWADMVKLIRSEEYVQAVINACETALEG